MSTIHNEAHLEDIAKTVIMPGDPLRAKYIAENFLTDTKLVNSVRGIYAFTGLYQNKKITVMASGMGMPSMGIYSYELFKYYNVENIIRIGSCGGYDPNLKLFDIILAQNVYTEGNYDETKNRFVYDIGETTEIELADGTKINVGNKSTEWKLYDFITNEANSVSDDKTQGWITMDRVYFETNKNTLDAESRQQLDNIAAILKAYPNAKAKFGGYTDNAGADDVNVPLSEARAKAVMADVVNSGIDAGRLSAEGYGSQHPICPANDTPTCMAQNRRVDIKVTAK